MLKDNLVGIARETYALWLDMGVYLVFGFFIAGVLSRALKKELIERHLGGHSLWAVTKATLFGIPLPLCSCGVIPVALSLHKRGASRGATTAFLISTPQTGVDSIAVTWGMLGPVFALARPVAALINGLLGGGVVSWLDRHDKAEMAQNANVPDECSDGCGPQSDCGKVSFAEHCIKGFRYGFIDFPREIAGWLVVGILAAGVIAHLLPSEHELLQDYLGTGILPMIVMLVVGVPLYICATASVPIVAVLVAKGGLSAGAALVFLMAGPATNIATLLLIGRTMGRRTAGVYLASIVFTSFFCGLLLDYVFRASGTTLSVIAQHQSEHEMIPMAVQIAGGVALAFIVAGGLIGQHLRNRVAKQETRKASAMKSAITLRVDGMTCGGCANNVRKAANAVAGVETVLVDLKAKTVSINGPNLDAKTIAKAIEEKGYNVLDQ